MKKAFTLTLAALTAAAMLAGPAPAAPAGPAVEGAPALAERAAPVDLNTAGIDELVAVKGVGPALAQKIVDLRNRLGGFASIDDLLEIRGIGPKSLARLRPAFTLTRPPSPVAQSPAPNSLP